jgi:hypothetical protein
MSRKELGNLAGQVLHAIGFFFVNEDVEDQV